MKAGRLVLRHSPLFVPILFFIGWAGLSVLRSPYTAASAQWLLSILSYAAMLFLVVHLVENRRQVKWLVMIVVSVALFEAALGIYQFVWGDKSRATGTFFNANFFASYEVAALAVVFGLLCFRRGEEGGRWKMLVLWLTAGVLALAFILAQSRGALIALVAAMAFVGLYRFGKVFLGILVLGFVVGALVPNPLQQRVLTIGTQDPYAYTRLEIWKNSFQRFVEHPWGVGLGIYKYTSFRYRFPEDNAVVHYGKRAESAHNEYLQVAVELGLPGLVFLLLGGGLLGHEIHDVLRSEKEAWEQGLAVGVSGGIIGIFVHGAVDSVFHEPALVLFLILFAGMILVLKRLGGAASAPVWVMPFPYHPARVVLVGFFAAVLTLLIIQPAAAWHAFERGEGEASAGREDRALEWFQCATRINSGVTAYRDAVALAEVRLYRQSGDPQWLMKAIEERRIGLELNPLDGRFARRLGDLYLLLADRADPDATREALLNQAATSYEQATHLDPFSPFNYFELGKIRWAQGDLEEAQAWFRQATRHEPNFLSARVKLAELDLQRGQKRLAALEYAEIIKIKEQYKGRGLNALERQYLEVDHDHLQQMLAKALVP